MTTTKLTGCKALITGASAGIGWEFARQLAGRAQLLILVARRRDRLEALQAELQKLQPDLDFRIYPTDLSTSRHVEDLWQWLEQNQIEIDLLVNNAGLGDAGLFAGSDPERISQMIGVNIEALTLLTRRVLPSMVARKKGAILNVSSCASFLPIPGSAVYAATKAYVTSLSEAIRAEVHDTGVTVMALCPGPVETEFAEVARRPERAIQSGPKASYVSVQDVVTDALAGLEHNRAIVIPGMTMKVAMILARLTPMPILRRALRMAARRIQPE